MNRTTHWIMIAAVALVAVVLMLLPRHRPPQEPAVSTVETTPPPAKETLQRFPVPQPAAPTSATATAPEQALPTLQDSDSALHDALARVSDPVRLGELLIFKNLIQRLVITIDNLPRAKLPLRDLPTQAPTGKFLVREQGAGKAEINPNNYHRYDAYVRLADSVDSRKLAAIYFHFYPLFQEAYSDLGYKSAYFNDRLVAVIDDLLATPRVSDPVQLVQPAVLYKYADPRLESLSAGQKLMIRIGADNAERIKVKLRELRRALTTQSTAKP